MVLIGGERKLLCEFAQQLLGEGFGLGGICGDKYCQADFETVISADSKGHILMISTEESMRHFGTHQEKQKPDLADAFSRLVMVAPHLTMKELNPTDQARIQAMDEAQTKALAWDQLQAEQGDAYGQLRMGERYRDGDGVAKDLVMARSWLSKSAYQGNSHAIKALSKLLKR